MQCCLLQCEYFAANTSLVFPLEKYPNKSEGNLCEIGNYSSAKNSLSHAVNTNFSHCSIHRMSITVDTFLYFSFHLWLMASNACVNARYCHMAYTDLVHQREKWRDFHSSTMIAVNRLCNYIYVFIRQRWIINGKNTSKPNLSKWSEYITATHFVSAGSNLFVRT